MTDTGYTTRPVTELDTADLLEEALQAADTAGYCAAKYPHSLQFSEARDRRDQCFAELRRRLEAAEALVQKANRLALRIENWDGGDDYYILRDNHDLRDALRPFQKETYYGDS